MSKIRVHNPVTGEVLEYPIPLRWSRTAATLMTLYTLGLACFAGVAAYNFKVEDYVTGLLFTVLSAALLYVMRDLYKAVRLVSNVNAQVDAMLKQVEGQAQ